MSFFASATTAYKPAIIRQEGFHLPNSPNPPSPQSSSSGGNGGGNNNSSSGNNNSTFDLNNNMFMSHYLPDSFRKFHGAEGGGSSMDFGDELASLMVHSPAPPSSHERSTQSPGAEHNNQNSSNGFGGHADEPYRPHNIFDISAPTSHHHSSSQSHLNGGFPSHFSLPPPSHAPHRPDISQPSSLHSHHTHNAGPGSLHESPFHGHFNSTLPALNSSLRFDPQPPPPHQTHPPPLESSSLSSTSTFNSHLQGPGGAGNGAAEFEFSHIRTQHTPSPSLSHSHTRHSHVSRSRSRSRAPSNGPTQNSLVGVSSNPSGPGPTRTQSSTRAKRNSISSTSPPPRPTPTAIVIPRSSHQHTSGWFIPQQHTVHHPEFSLPTPDSTSASFGQFGSSLGISPKDVSGGIVGGGVGLKGESPPIGVDDVAAKQAAIASEKRRRRRESHNAVERRRRDNINEKISELATLIPECMLDPNAPTSTPTETDLIPTSPDGTAGSGNPGASPNTPNLAAANASTPTAEKAGAGAGGEGEGGQGGVKANKGMILRKSVEYIRYLQQLVTAQASRNRDLEQQLSALRGHESGQSSTNGTPMGVNGIMQNHHKDDGDDMGGLMLHEEVVGMGMGMNGLHFGNHNGGSNYGRKGSGGSASFHGFDHLESVEEMDHDHDMDVVEDQSRSPGGGVDDDVDGDARPGTAVSAASQPITSPSAAGSDGDGGSDEQEREREEEERGRRGRDGRVREVNGSGVGVNGRKSKSRSEKLAKKEEMES